MTKEGEKHPKSDKFWEAASNTAEQLTFLYYSWGRKWRYKRTTRQLAKHIAQVWEKRYANSSNPIFTLTYFASRRRKWGLNDQDFSLWFYAYGFNYEERLKTIRLTRKLLYLRFLMHPADAMNRKVTVEVQENIILNIVDAFPKRVKQRYSFSTENMKVYPGDLEMQPDNCWMKRIVATRLK